MNSPDLKSLAGIRLFEGLDEPELARLEARCRWRRFRSGETVLDYGSAGREVFFVVAGAVNILNRSFTGREVAFAGVRAGDCFGELAAIDGQPRSASVVCAEDGLIAIMAADHFLDLLKHRAEITFRVLERLAHMVRSGDVRIMELSTLAATQRVYAELLRMAEPDAAGQNLWVIRSMPPLKDIASRVSTTRETVARALGQLYPTGLVRRKGRNLYLMDRAGLEKMINAAELGGRGSL